MRLTTFLLFLVLILSINKNHAQVASLYTFAYSAGTYTAITGGTQAYGSTFDDGVTSVTIPSFDFNGTVYTSINISTNGFITFGATAPATTNYTPISSTAGYSGAISAFGRDLNYAAAGSPEVRYETVGSEFVIQWQDARRFNIASERISFQIRLNTTTNAIVIVYGGTIAPGSNTTYPQVGLRGTANTDYNNRSVTASAWSGSAAGGANTSTCYFNSAQSTYVPASGATFTWTRSTCTPPTTQVSLFTQSAAGSTTSTVGWTRGNGDNVLVVASTASALTADPASGTSYTANAAYGSGTALGGGYVVYAGTGTSVNLTALTANTTYYFTLYEYNTSGTCYNQAQLTGSASTANTNTSLTIGTGSTASSGTYYGPFKNYWENNKTQILYKKSEMGAIAYTISHLALNISFVTVDAAKRDFDNFTIKLMHTSTTSFSTAYETTTGATTVFSSADYAMPTSTGWNTFDITDFAYNGTDNLLVEIVWGDNAEFCGVSDYYTINHTDYTSGGDYLVTYGYADAETPPLYDGRSYLRPNIKFTIASCAVVAGMAASSASSVSACNTTTSLTLSGQDGGTTLQWQWSPDNTKWYNLSGLTTSSETSPYISRSTEYFRVAVTNSCVSLSTVVSITSSAASACNFWEGTVSTAAMTASNWSLATVPASTTTDVLITKGTAYTCTFPSSGTDDLDMDDLYIQENATLDNLDDNLTSAIWISGNLVCNGTISYSTNGQSYVVMLGTGKTITAGGSANMSAMRLQIGLTGYSPTITLASNIAVHECLVYTTGTLSLSTYTLQCKYFGNNTASSTFNLNSGTLEVGGGTAFDKSGAHLTGKTNPYFESGTVNFGTGTVFYNAGEDYSAVDQTVKTKTYYNLKVRTNNGYTVTIGSGAGLAVSNNFEITNPSTAGGVATLAYATDFNGSITNGSGAVFNGGALSHTLAGNWTNNGTFNCSTGTITLDGGSAQTINGSSATSFYNLTMANTSGGVSLTVNSTVTNTLTLTSGKLTVQGYTLSIGTNSANGSISGGSSSTYIVAYDNSGTIGYVKRFVNSNAAYAYPIGDATNYTPLTFTLTAGTLSSAYLTLYTKATKVTGLSSSITSYINRYWNLTQSGITSPIYDISYTYVDGDIIGSETGMLPIKKSGSTWYKPTGSSFTDGTAEGTGSLTAGSNLLSWTGLSTFSLFGGAVNGAVALPVELLVFTGKKEGGNNALYWETSTESNNDFFTIEKTYDGSTYEIVGIEDGAGNSNQSIQYILTDYDVREVINYYRLKQTDFDGKYTFSNVIAIDNRVNTPNKEVVLITNILGQEVNEFYRGIVIIVYADGTSVKVIQ